jgi:hypothetical protein
MRPGVKRQNKRHQIENMRQTNIEINSYLP